MNQNDSALQPDHTPAADHLAAVLADLASALDHIGTARDGHPTPCADFDVATLRQHTVGWLTAFADGYAHPDGQCSDAAAVVVDGTGAQQVREAAASLSRCLPDAAARPLRIGEAAMPGDMALAMILWEYQMHGWDLARATGQEWSPDSGGLDASLAFAPGMLTPDYQGEGKSFAPPVQVAADAPALDRLLGLSGRDPQWTPVG
ncbi:MAG: TIGR03086 family protein [Phycicoccus sp.]|nr:TIGR03086 family protein [Phycicoccus sp.]